MCPYGEYLQLFYHMLYVFSPRNSCYILYIINIYHVTDMWYNNCVSTGVRGNLTE